MHLRICRLTLGACPAANRTYATYGDTITADVSVRVCGGIVGIRDSPSS